MDTQPNADESGLIKALRRGHVSLALMFVAAFIAAINTHGYTIISTVISLANFGVLVGLRHAAKTEAPDSDSSWFWMAGSMVLAVLPQFPPNTLMLWITLIYGILNLAIRFVAKYEKKNYDA